MKSKEYNEILGGRITAMKKERIITQVFMMMHDSHDILFKNGKWHPLKWHSVKRWIKLARIAYRLVKMVLAIMKG